MNSGHFSQDSTMNTLLEPLSCSFTQNQRLQACDCFKLKQGLLFFYLNCINCARLASAAAGAQASPPATSVKRKVTLSFICLAVHLSRGIVDLCLQPGGVLLSSGGITYIANFYLCLVQI